MWLMCLVSCLESEVRGQRSSLQTGATRTSPRSTPVLKAHKEAESRGEDGLLCFLGSKWPQGGPESCLCPSLPCPVTLF